MLVTLKIVSGPAKGKTFTFHEHDTFVFGRMEDCHARIVDDKQVSRHHFLLEACPPKAALRDLGSLNGTYVNGTKHGGRKRDETPEQGAKRRYPAMDLKDGDVIAVGQTRMEVGIARASAPPAVHAEVQPGAFSEMSPDELFALVFQQEGKEGLLEIPGYHVEKELGRGGFGAVYRARRKKDGVAVAIKVMLSQAEATEEAVLKFKREMDVARQLDHRNIVRFLESGSHGGAFYFVMDLCDGGSLQDAMRRRTGPFPVDQLLPWLAQALVGLAYAHGKGFVHRDLKPSNILLHSGEARISDFGLSKSFQLAGLSGMSVTGQTAGSALFMPPEQIINFKYVKPVSDVFSLGATFYFLGTGAFPFDFSQKRDPMDVILNDEVVSVRDRGVKIPAPFARFLDKAVAKKTKERFRDAAEMRAALEGLGA